VVECIEYLSRFFSDSDVDNLHFYPEYFLIFWTWTIDFALAGQDNCLSHAGIKFQLTKTLIHMSLDVHRFS
jgi:hypothetical protein